MIIFLNGPDDYRREEKKRSLVADFTQKHTALGVAHFDFEDDESFLDLERFSAHHSLFTNQQLAVVTNLFEKESKERTALLESMVSRPGVTLLLSEDTKPLKRFQFLTEKPVILGHFDFLTGAPWEAFVQGEAQKRNLAFSPEVLRFLLMVYEKDTWRLVIDLDKLALLGKQKIERKDLEVLDLEVRPSFWEMMSGLKSSDLGRRLATLERLFYDHEPAAKSFNILSAQWKERIQSFAAYDVLVKTGKLEYEEVLLDLLL